LETINSKTLECLNYWLGNFDLIPYAFLGVWSIE
jgi:hypothetical protein